jgi:glycosyltransferase involved in cell wall biosynthesis
MRSKVMHIIHEGQGGGGATLSLTYFPPYQAHFDTHVVTGCRGDLAERLRAKGMRVQALELDRPLRSLFSIPRLLRLIKKEKPDVVVVHGQWGGFAGAVAARGAGVKRVIYYTHMPTFYTDWDFYRIVRNRIAEAVTCYLAQLIVCPSRANRYQYLLRKLAPENRFVYIPNCVPDRHPPLGPAEKAAQRVELGLPTEGELVVSVGRLEDQKCVDWLVEAWAIVEGRHPTAHLCIVGDGRDRQALEALARARGLQRCHFWGAQKEGHRYFQVADVGVITSMFEALSLSLLEAMMCGCPMVGTKTDGVAEAIEDGVTGRVVRVADPGALAEALSALLTDRTGALKMGEKARAKALAEYELGSVLEKQFEAVRQLLAP